MERQALKHHISKEKEGSYYRLPLNVPAGMEEMTVRYSYDRSGNNCVDLGLCDEKGDFLGWSGSARQEIQIGPYCSTPGYRLTELREGTWFILVGAYHIPQEGLEVCYEITFRPPGPRWLKGDLHMHSTASDGQYEPFTLAQRAKKLGLDFIAVADHNNYCENLHLPVLPGLTMIPAVEWTHYKGHINFFGVEAPFENSFVANTEEQMQKLLSQVAGRDALISLNHPKDSLCPYLWEAEEGFHMIEVWNGPMRPGNLRAADWWHKLLLAGKKIPVVGGSDFHRDKSPVRLGRPTTFVYTKTPAVKDICSALAHGRSFVTSSPNGVRLSIDGACFGDRCKSQRGKVWNFRAENGGLGMKLRLMTDKGISAEVPFRMDGTAVVAADEDDWRFAYLTVGYKVGAHFWIRAISNPIWFG